jgi:sulfatase modifying factor 1
LLTSGGYQQTWTDVAGANENLPIKGVSWYEAFAFCIWDGGRLPTESEWEYAAAGGSENRLYPWGSAPPDISRANYDPIRTSWEGPAGYTTVAAVGTRPAGNGRWGHSDLAGNLQEWALDWWGWYPTSAVTNCANISSGSERVYRGGNCESVAYYLRVPVRSSMLPEWRSFTGLRCARTSPEVTRTSNGDHPNEPSRSARRTQRGSCREPVRVYK